MLPSVAGLRSSPEVESISFLFRHQLELWVPTDPSLTPLATPIPFIFPSTVLQRKSSALKVFIPQPSTNIPQNRGVHLDSKLAGKTIEDFLLLLSSESISISLLQDLEQSVLQLCRPLFTGRIFGASVKHVQCVTFMQFCEWFRDCVIIFFLKRILFSTCNYPLGSLEFPHQP